MDPGAMGLILATLAGLSTTFGAAVVFFLKDYSVKPFAICMSLSASVMIYVAFIEMFPSAIESFSYGLEKKGYTESDAYKWGYLWATITFLIGWVFTTVFDKCIQGILNHCGGLQSVKLNSLPSEQDIKNNDPEKVHQSASADDGCGERDGQVTNAVYVDVATREPILTAEYVASKSGNDDSPNYYSHHQEDITAVHIDQATIEPHQDQQIHVQDLQQHDVSTTDSSKNSANEIATQHKGKELLRKILLRSQTTESDKIAIAIAEENFKRQHASFSRLGIVTGLALFFHNFPDGLATFSASLADPGLGLGIATATAIRNIPEGFAVAVPIYFGTGSKWKGFWYSFLSGCAEPVGALIAYFIIGDNTNQTVFGAIFAFMAGMISNIAIKGLYPTAVRYDPTNRVVSLSYFAGLLLITSSLIGFKFLQ